MLKKPKQRNELTSEEADLLANRLADRPYGEEKKDRDLKMRWRELPYHFLRVYCEKLKIKPYLTNA